MEQQTAAHSPQFLRKRRFLLVMPLLVFPFLSLFFWALGGGKTPETTMQQKPAAEGLNTLLPAAHLKDEAGWTKMDYYKQADEDSARRLEQIQRDPYYTLPVLSSTATDTSPLLLIQDKKPAYQSLAPLSVFAGDGSADPNEVKVYRKLAELDASLQQNNPGMMQPKKKPLPVLPGSSQGAGNADIDRLEAMMQHIQPGNPGDDPELQQINHLLEKALDVQHPERINQKLQEQSVQNKGAVFAVRLKQGSRVSTLGSAAIYARDTGGVANRFYSLQTHVRSDHSEEPLSAIPAAMHETQVLVSGATVKLRLLEDIYVNGILIPRFHFVYGQAQLHGERLSIVIESIRYGSHILPVSLIVYDLDGMEGIAVPGAITRDVAKQSADQSLQSIGLSSLNTSLGAQAASAGIDAAKSLVSKKVKLVKVTVKAGYQVLLKDGKDKS